MQNCLLSQPWQETSTARADIGCSHQGSQPALHATLERALLCLDCIHGILFCARLKEMSQISSPCPHLRWIEQWYMANAPETWWYSTGLGVERKMTFCSKHQEDKFGHVVLSSSFLIVRCHFIYTQKMAGNLQQHQGQDKFLKNPINIL